MLHGSHFLVIRREKFEKRTLARMYGHKVTSAVRVTAHLRITAPVRLPVSKTA